MCVSKIINKNYFKSKSSTFFWKTDFMTCFLTLVERLKLFLKKVGFNVSVVVTFCSLRKVSLNTCLGDSSQMTDTSIDTGVIIGAFFLLKLDRMDDKILSFGSFSHLSSLISAVDEVINLRILLRMTSPNFGFFPGAAGILKLSCWVGKGSFAFR